MSHISVNNPYECVRARRKQARCFPNHFLTSDAEDYCRAVIISVMDNHSIFTSSAELLGTN